MGSTHARACVALLALTTGGLLAGCSGGSDPAVLNPNPQNPNNPFVPNDPAPVDSLAAPTNLQAQVSSQTIVLTFTQVPGAQGYNVYLSEDGGTTFLRINGNTPYPPVPQITLSGLVNGLSYFVGVSATANSGNLESAIAYVGGSPVASPLTPPLEPPPPPPDPDATIVITVWDETNVPALLLPPEGTTNFDGFLTVMPNDRRLSVSWHCGQPKPIREFEVRLGLGALNTEDRPVVPNTSANHQVFFNETIVAKRTILPGTTAFLNDPDFVDYPDPSMELIRPYDAAPSGRVRGEYVWERSLGSNLLPQLIAQLQNPPEWWPETEVYSLVTFLTSPPYNYSLTDLGIRINPDPTEPPFVIDQTALDATDRIGILIQVTAIFTDGSRSQPAFAAGQWKDFRPDQLAAPEIRLVPNGNFDPEVPTSPLVLPLLRWQRLLWPMGSDIADYELIRHVPPSLEGVPPEGLDFIYRASNEFGEEFALDGRLALDQSPQREFLEFVDSLDPGLFSGHLYSYTIMAIDATGFRGIPSPGVAIQVGQPATAAPTINVVITQGSTTIPTDGTGQVTAGNAQDILIDLTGSSAAAGRTIVAAQVQIDGGTILTDDDGDLMITIPQLGCLVTSPQDTQLVVTITDDGTPAKSASQTIDLEVVNDPSCP